MERLLIGHVVSYFAKIGTAAIESESGEIKVETLYFSGCTTDFEQQIGSIQIDRNPVESAQAGDSVGIKVKDRVRDGDEVYKVND